HATRRADPAGVPARRAGRSLARLSALPEGAGTAWRARAARPDARPGQDARTQAVRRCAGKGQRRRQGRRARVAGAALGPGGAAGIAVRAGTRCTWNLAEKTGDPAVADYLIRSTFADVL